MVTPQNKAPIPTAAIRAGEKPMSPPMAAPKVAPMKSVGTISPPLYPQERVRVVNIIFSKKAPRLMEAPVKQDAITAEPVLL